MPSQAASRNTGAQPCPGPTPISRSATATSVAVFPPFETTAILLDLQAEDLEALAAGGTEPSIPSDPVGMGAQARRLTDALLDFTVEHGGRMLTDCPRVVVACPWSDSESAVAWYRRLRQHCQHGAGVDLAGGFALVDGWSFTVSGGAS